jgi:hypothetical protein
MSFAVKFDTEACTGTDSTSGAEDGKGTGRRSLAGLTTRVTGDIIAFIDLRVFYEQLYGKGLYS